MSAMSDECRTEVRNVVDRLKEVLDEIEDLCGQYFVNENGEAYECLRTIVTQCDLLNQTESNDEIGMSELVRLNEACTAFAQIWTTLGADIQSDAVVQTSYQRFTEERIQLERIIQTLGNNASSSDTENNPCVDIVEEEENQDGGSEDEEDGDVFEEAEADAFDEMGLDITPEVEQKLREFAARLNLTLNEETPVFLQVVRQLVTDALVPFQEMLNRFVQMRCPGQLSVTASLNAPILPADGMVCRIHSDNFQFEGGVEPEQLPMIPGAVPVATEQDPIISGQNSAEAEQQAIVPVGNTAQVDDSSSFRLPAIPTPCTATVAPNLTTPCQGHTVSTSSKTSDVDESDVDSGIDEASEGEASSSTPAVPPAKRKGTPPQNPNAKKTKK